MTLHDDAVAVLESWQPPDAQGDALRADYLGFLAAHPLGMGKAAGPEHLTASALVVDPGTRRALLTLHAKGGFWVQTGGHCEPGDATVAGAALREATEESGIDGLTLLPAPVDLDHHRLSGAFGACTSHRDVRYVAIAPAGAEPRLSAESRDLRWFDLDALADGGPQADGAAPFTDVGRLAAAARAALR